VYLVYYKVKKRDLLRDVYSFLVNKLAILPSLLSKKEIEELNYYLWELHWNINPIKIGQASLTLLALGVIISLVFLLVNPIAFVLAFIFVTTIYFLFLKLPIILGKQVKEKKRVQLLSFLLNLAMFYKANPSLESAFYNSIRNTLSPLKEDLIELFWLVDLRKFSSIEDALEWYATRWESEKEFVHALYLVVYGKVEEAIDYYLQQYYYKMLKFSRELKNAVEVTNMLGIVLPVMTMTLLPVVIGVMAEEVPYTLLFGFYDIALPLIVFLLTRNLVEKKTPPTIFQFFESDYLSKRKFRLLLLIPIIIGWTLYVKSIYPRYATYEIAATYPSIVLILLLAFLIALVFVLYFIDIYSLQKSLDKMTKETPLFLTQLSEYLENGYPLEKAFALTREKLYNLEIRKFVDIVLLNLSENKTIRESINAALAKYPSPILRTIFDIILANTYSGTSVLVDLTKSLADYLNKVNSALERMKDLLSEAISEMKLQVTMLIPIMLGVIVGIGVFMIAMMKLITEVMHQFNNIGTQVNLGGANISVPLDVLKIFMIRKETITPFLYQLMVGLYVIAAIIIVSYSLNIIENSKDPIKEKIVISRNLVVGTLFYALVAFGVVLLFSGMFIMLKGVLTG